MCSKIPWQVQIANGTTYMLLNSSILPFLKKKKKVAQLVLDFIQINRRKWHKQ
jgi:hypothetical protein